MQDCVKIIVRAPATTKLISQALLFTTSSCISGAERDQLTLVSEAIKNYASADSPARLFDPFADSLDLKSLFRLECRPKRPACDPKNALKLYLWDTLTG